MTRATMPGEKTSCHSDAHYMAHALQLARRGFYSARPNPCVGCVIVKRGEIIGQGWHAKTGGAHAEAAALAQAGDDAKDARVFVTLEPCRVQGRTPPCTQALIRARVSQVVIADEDPNPQMQGAGVAELTHAGIQVDVGIARDAARRLNRGFYRRMQHARPWVTLKIAVSVDGKTAMASGESQWITSEAARLDAHKLRAGACAIVTGVGTILSDDPQLTMRADLPGAQQALRVILDRDLRTPPDAKIFQTKSPVLLLTAKDATSEVAMQYKHEHAEVARITQDASGNLDARAALSELARREINHALFEAGAALNGAMLAQNLVDEIIVYMSPDALGDDARGMFKMPGLTSLQQRIALRFVDARMVGDDLRVTLAPRA